MTRVAYACLVAAAAAVLAGDAPAADAHARGLAAGWELVTAGAAVPSLHAVAALSPTDVWAVGGGVHWTEPNADRRPYAIVHWDGRALRSYAAAGLRVRPTTLTSVAASSRRDVWAVGWEGDDYLSSTVLHPVVVHWDRRVWQRVALPALPGRSARLEGIAAFAPNVVWAVGTMPRSRESALVLRFDGRRFRRVDLTGIAPPDSELHAISGTSANDVWAVGTTWLGDGVHYREDLALHWNGQRWSRVPRFGYAESLDAVDALAVNAVWAVTGFTDTSGAVVRWNGRATRVHETESPYLAAVAATSQDDAWAVGDVVAHWDGRRLTEWTPAFLSRACRTCAVAALLGLDRLRDGELWAVGTHVIARYSSERLR